MRADELYAICLRAMKRLLANKLELAFGVAFPLFIMFVLGAGIGSFVKINVANLDYTSFLGPGILALWAMSAGVGVGHSLIEDKHGFIKEMLVSPISRTSIIVGMALSGMVSLLVVIALATLAFLLYTKALSFATLIWALLVMSLISFGLFSFGIVLASLFKKTRNFELFSGGVTMLLIFTSGIFYPTANLPLWLKAVVVVNPLTYGVDALRGVMTGYTEFGLFFDIIGLVVFAIAMTALGSYAFKRMTAQ